MRREPITVLLAEHEPLASQMLQQLLERHGLRLASVVGSADALTARMGSDPQTSVLNASCQAHDIRNLFVADGGPFVSNAHKNCTWTILALAMRTAEFVARSRNQGTL